MRDAFFAARPFRDLDDLNAQASAWTDGLAGDRRWPEDRARTVRDTFVEERGRLLALPGDPFPADERTEVDIGKTPYARFDLNDYSLPSTYVRRTLALVASTSEVRILDGTSVIATHVRSYDRGQQLEHPEHIRALVEQKRAGREHRSLDRLHHAAPQCQELLRIVAERGGNVGRTVWLLTQLLDTHSAQSVDAAIGEAIARDSPHVGAVRQALDRARQLTGEPPPVGLHLPADPRLDSIRARPHALSTYDQLRKADTDDHED